MATTEFKQHAIQVKWNEPDENFPEGWDFSIEAAARGVNRRGNVKFWVEDPWVPGRLITVWSNEIDHYIELFQAMKAYANKEEN